MVLLESGVLGGYPLLSAALLLHMWRWPSQRRLLRRVQDDKPQLVRRACPVGRCGS